MFVLQINQLYLTPPTFMGGVILVYGIETIRLYCNRSSFLVKKSVTSVTTA